MTDRDMTYAGAMESDDAFAHALGIILPDWEDMNGEITNDSVDGDLWSDLHRADTANY
jgi:hypothetical protein